MAQAGPKLVMLFVSRCCVAIQTLWEHYHGFVSFLCKAAQKNPYIASLHYPDKMVTESNVHQDRRHWPDIRRSWRDWNGSIITFQIKGIWISFHNSLNLTPMWADCCWQPLSGFSRTAKKRCRTVPPNFEHLVRHPFCTFPDKFLPRSSQVSARGQVMRLFLLESLWCYSGYHIWEINMKLSKYHKIISTNKTHISYF